MKEKIELLKRGILEALPQFPIIVDQVGAALDVVEKELDEGKVYRTFKDVKKVVDYTLSTSEPKFFKTYLVVASALLAVPDILEKEDFKQFESTSGSVRKAVEAISVDEKLTEEEGCFKAVALNMLDLVEKDQDYIALALISILGDLEEIVQGLRAAGEKRPITPSDYITVLGYATVINRVGLVRSKFLGETREVLNDIKIILNSEVNY